MTKVSVFVDCADCQIAFKSDDQSFHLRDEDDWWTVDSVDDRGQRYNGTAKFSTFELAEEYLIWKWASVSRSTIRVKHLGRQLHAFGVNPDVEVIPTERDYFVELRVLAGSAVLPMSSATVFSHVISKSVNEIEQLVHEDLR